MHYGNCIKEISTVVQRTQFYQDLGEQIENLREALSRGSYGLRSTCQGLLVNTKSVKVHKYTRQRRSDRPEEEVLPICDIEVAGILLDVRVAECRGAEPETMIRKSIEFDLFVTGVCGSAVGRLTNDSGLLNQCTSIVYPLLYVQLLPFDV